MKSQVCTPADCGYPIAHKCHMCVSKGHAPLVFAALLSRHSDSSLALGYVMQVHRLAAAIIVPLILLAAPLVCATRPMSTSQALVLEAQLATRQLLQIASVTGVIVPANTCTFPSGTGAISLQCESGYNTACCDGSGSSNKCSTGDNPNPCGNYFSQAACCPIGT